MIIPFDSLKPETIRALVEEFVLREGTDYGAREASLESKVAAVMKQLESGDVEVVYDPKTESCGLRETVKTKPFGGLK